jgi:hypothetical protein
MVLRVSVYWESVSGAGAHRRLSPELGEVGKFRGRSRTAVGSGWMRVVRRGITEARPAVGDGRRRSVGIEGGA